MNEATFPKPVPLDLVRGDDTGMLIPAHPGALAAGGETWLTEAFRTFGALAADNAVTRILAVDPCPGGSTGSKVFLHLEYAHDAPGLDAELFVKFSRDFSDGRRDWQRHEMESEARFGAVTRVPGFPIGAPTAYFSDYEAASGTGIIITQRIRFGEGGIELHRRKCLDYLTLPDPLPYYRTTVTALARLAGAHKAGRLTDDIDRRFPFDPVTASADPVRDDEATLRLRLAQCRDFAARCPQLLPPEVRDPAFLDRVERDAVRIRAHEAEIQRFLVGNPDLIALCHWNAHIDNAWFWRDEVDALHCGLIDWGRVGQISFGSALWGGLSAAHHSIWDDHLTELLGLFVAEYHAAGGPLITVEALEFHLTLHMAMMGVSRGLIFPEVVLLRQPDAPNATGPEDAMFEPVEYDAARNCLHVYTVLLKYWRRRNFGAHVDAVLAGAP
jgi:hypothetical protein